MNEYECPKCGAIFKSELEPDLAKCINPDCNYDGQMRLLRRVR